MTTVVDEFVRLTNVRASLPKASKPDPMGWAMSDPFLDVSDELANQFIEPDDWKAFLSEIADRRQRNRETLRDAFFHVLQTRLGIPIGTATPWTPAAQAIFSHVPGPWDEYWSEA